MKNLRELLSDVSIIEEKGDLDMAVSSISANSKEAGPGSLFIAIAGNVADGHDYIDQAIKSGAKAIVHEKDLSNFATDVAYIKVPDSHEALGYIASSFYNSPSQQLRLVGVTGTNGKTTIATLLYQLFSNLGYKVGLIGTVANKIHSKVIEASRTTPDPITLNKLLAEMVSEGCQYCFMEVSSHAVAEKRIAGITFAGGIFTNLTLDHLDYHKTFENYRTAKKGFFDSLPIGAFALSNKDDENGKHMLSGTRASKSYYSLKQSAEFTDRLESRLIGEFNMYNILAIYGASVLLGEDKEKVKSLVKGLEPVAGRFQYVTSTNGVTGIVDYAHTPDALENVLRTIGSMKKEGKVISVFGCGGDRDKSKRPIMARIGYDMSDILILTSDNPRTEKAEDILKDIQKGIEELPQDKVFIIADRHDAIQKVCELARNGDLILIAGKGHENYQEVNGVKSHFDDMEELKKYLLK